MKFRNTFFTYVRDLTQETFFLILLFLGMGSTASTYIPKLQNYTILKWIGLLSILSGFLGANFRLYCKLKMLSHQAMLNLIDELEYNRRILGNIKWSTAPSLRDETWKVASDKMLNIPDTLRTQLNNAYMEIRSAKEIHETIRSIPVPVSPYTIPEQIDIEKHLMAVEFALPDIIKRLRNISER